MIQGVVLAVVFILANVVAAGVMLALGLPLKLAGLLSPATMVAVGIAGIVSAVAFIRYSLPWIAKRGTRGGG